MGAAAEFDIGPLTWVKGEIEQALARAGVALVAYRANPADSTQIKFCKTHLHQAHGALEIVGLEGVTRLTEECERILEGAQAGTLELDAARAEALVLAFTSLPVYLNELVDGASHQPVRLFPAYKAVMQARGAERIAESDLFFPDLSARPPQREAPEVPPDMREHVMAQRRRFQSGLLRWLRNSADPAALKDMGDAVRAIERTQAVPQHRAFWWITTGFAETLQESAGAVDLDVKRLCARIDMQMKRLMEGSPNVAQRLMRDALYFVAKSRANGSAVKELRAFYRLEGVVPTALAPASGAAHPQEAALRAIREILAVAKDKWNKFSAGQTHELNGFREQAGQLKEKTTALGHAEFGRLVNAISVVTVWVSENPAKVTEAIAIETATALLLAENATDNFARLGEEFANQVATMAARLKASLAGQTANLPSVALLDEMTRKAQERLLMAQVVSEIKSNLGGIETALDAFFRDAAQRGELPGLDKQIRQVQGALTILGSDKAVAALQGCQADIARFAQADYAPQQADFERVANTLSVLGFYVDAMQHGSVEYDDVARPAGDAPRQKRSYAAEADAGAAVGASLRPSDPADGALEGSVEAELEQEKQDARTLFDAWRQEPHDAVLTAELKATLESIKNDADLVDDPSLRLSAADVLAAIQMAGLDAGVGAAGSAPPRLAQIDQAMAKIAPARPAAADAVAAAAVPEVVPEEAVDAELLAIFLEEAEEVLANVGEHHGLVQSSPGHKEYLTIIRRAFHTLKGSGRMVGLMRFGDAAWSVEQTINQWMQEGKPANADLLGLIEAGRELFVRWVNDLSSQATSSADAKPLIAAAERVRSGGKFEAAGSAPAAPVPPVAAASAPPAAPVAPAVMPVIAAGGAGAAGVAGAAMTASGAAAATTQAAAPEAVTPLTPATPPDPTITIGDIRVSRGLYTIFVDEAGTHLDTVQREVALLEAEPQPPRDELVRAAHTLAGIAGTVNFKKLHSLGRAFERMLLAAKGSGVTLGEADLMLARDSAKALDAMLLAVRELRAPPAADDLEAQLEMRRAEWSSAAEETANAEPSDALLARFVLPNGRDTSPAAASDTPPMAASEAAVPAFDTEIDFASLGAGAPAAEPPPAAAPMFTPDFSFHVESLGEPQPAAPAAEMPSVDAFFASITDSAGGISPSAAAPDPAPVIAAADDAGGGFSFHIEDIALPSAPMPAAAPEEPPAELSLRFMDDAVADTALPVTAAVPVMPPAPDLGDHTILAAASGALAASFAAAALTSAPASSAPVNAAAASAATSAAGGMPTDDELRARGFDTNERRQERLDDEIDDQLLPIFLEEANELMPQIGEQLRGWAEGGNAQGLQRSLHTLKGSARMAGAMALGQLTHSMETRVDNTMQLPSIPPAIFEGLFSSFDRLTMLVEQLKTFDPAARAQVADAGRALLAEDDASKLVQAFDAAAPVAAAVADTAADTGAELASAASAAAGAPAAAPLGTAAKAAEDARAMLRVRADVIDRLVNEAGEVAIARSRIEGEMRAIKGGLKDLTENLIRLRAQLREIEIAAESQMQSRQREVEEKHASFDPLEFDRFSRFQEITRMMAESVNDVATVQQNLLRNLDDADAALLAQNRLNRDLQNDLMRVRMVPFNNVAERLYRVVRQTAKELGKRANLDIKGTQVEIDRSVLERMTGPFEHLLRNAIAHGLEDPQGRMTANKTDIGQIALSARQEGNEFVLVFEDDGRGLDIARIRSKAVANGLMAAGDQLPDAQIAEFIFASGFSTAAEVSEVSGRGVGMDVVRAEVTALGGRVEIDFTPGKGSRFTIFLPLTLAVTQVVLIRTGQRTFAVPSAMVEQVRQVKIDELDKAYAAGKFEWLGREYPLQFLPRLLGDAAQTAEGQRFTPVLLLRSGLQRAAIHVDEMIGNQEVVVKNIGPQLARVSGISGATVLGTGQIVLILNPVPLVTQIVALAAMQSGAAGGDALGGTGTTGTHVLAPTTAAPSAAAAPVSAQPTIMVVDDSLTVRKITSRLLTRENYQVLTAKDGVDALEQLNDLRPDVMLVDVEMPRMDGFDLTRNVRGDDSLKGIPIIMITSRTADKHRNYAMEIGVNVFLGKPYQEEELLEHIAFLVKNRADATVTVH